ncbi:hypothetical protein F5876DRAFT_82918 [Lentinula aff. lateritia]|uniref:Uncharacterized protein n=1 Tax=Lentinula aff. lateritia TaxID=2804960 RepID=A0ACC1TJ13_9AGAR|nr:hypothetical protein F5876DRAFT_82918 [Lentinula aff. lateritia]
MASTSSQTRAAASTTLLPSSLMEAQVMLAGIPSKSTLPLFFESAVFKRLLEGDYSPPVVDSTNSPDYDGSGTFPAFSYPRSLVPFCFPSDTSRPLSVASGLDLFCSAQMAVWTLQDLVDDSPPTESEVYNVFEEAAPFLVLLSAESLSLSLPAFLRDDLTQQWGIPPEHRSSAESVHKFERFPAIPIPFCLRFREGSAMMRSVSSKDLDVFASLRGKGSLAGASKLNTPAPPLEIKSSTSVAKALVAPPRLIRRNRELESLKAEASTFFSSPRSTHSRDSDNELLSGFPSVGSAPRASSSAKVSIGRKEPKSSTTVKVVEGSKASDSPMPAMVYKRVRLPPCSRKNTLIASKGKARQIVVTDGDSASNEVESEDEGEGEDEEEDAVPPPKPLKTTPSISTSIPRRSAKRVSVPKRVTKATAKPAPKHSSGSTFQPVLLADVQGRLRLPEQSTGEFTPFPKFAHARNSAALNRENPLLAINPEFLELGSILETQNARFTMQDLMQVNRVIHDPSLPSQACVSALARGDLEANSAPLPGYKCQACSSQSLKCLGSLDVELAMDALNALYTASTSNLANSLRRAADLNDQLKQIGSLFDTARELFLRSILDLQNAGEDPVVVLEALNAAEPNRQAINLNEWTILATLFHWPSPFNLSGLDFDNRTPGEWIELLRSIHSGESTARVDEDGHLVESSPPPDSAAEALEGLNDVEKGSADEGTSSQVGGSIPMELDLPMIESLAEPTLSPEKGTEPAQTL